MQCLLHLRMYGYGQSLMVQIIADKITEICRGLQKLPILCRNLQEAFGSCQFFAAICMKLLAVANSLPQFAGSF